MKHAVINDQGIVENVILIKNDPGGQEFKAGLSRKKTVIELPHDNTVCIGDSFDGNFPERHCYKVENGKAVLCPEKKRIKDEEIAARKAALMNQPKEG